MSELPWPGVENTDGMAGTLEQDFLVNWLYSPDLENPNLAGIMELEFEGLNGSFAGEKGRPGVEYNPELGIYRANVSLIVWILYNRLNFSDINGPRRR